MKRNQREAVISAVGKFVDSLVTHLPYCVEVKNKCAHCGDRKFATDTSIEYAEEILKLLKSLR